MSESGQSKPRKAKNTAGRSPSWRGAVLAPILLLVLNLFVFGTMTVYFGNQGEFLVEDEDILLVLLLPASIVFVLFSVITYLASRRSLSVTSAIMFFLAFVTYLHGNLLRWETGILDGAALQTGRIGPVLADIAVWLVLGLLVWRFRRWLAIHGWKICVLLMVFQLIGAVDLKHSAKVGNRQLQEVPLELSSFNDGPNVVHLILDGFQGNVFEQLISAEPGLAAELDGFVHFRDVLTPSAVTYLSVPATLSGKAFDNSTTITAYHDETLGGDNLYSYLSGNNYEVDVASPVWWNLDRDYFSSYYRVPAPFASLEDTIRNTAWYLLDISLFRQMPYPLKSAIYRNGAWLFSSEMAKHPEQRFEHFAHSAFLQSVVQNAAADRNKPTYKLFHVITPHAPLVSNTDCSYTGRELDIAIDSFTDQSRCTVRTVQSVLSRLRELGIYDDALIIIHGDHGGGVAIDMKDASGDPTSSFEELPGFWGNPLPLLLVKPANSSGPMKSSDRHVSLVDLPVTVADLLDKPHGFPGVSMFSDDPATPRRMFYNSTQHRNEAMEKGRFADFSSFAVDGSIFDVESWSKVDQFNASPDDLAGEYQLGTELTFGRSGSFKPFGAGGWTVTRNNDINWTQGKESGLLLPIQNPARGLQLSFTVKPLLEAGKLDRQRLTVVVNDQELESFELTEARFKTHKVRIPADVLQDDRLSLRFLLPDATSPLILGSGEDDRELALAFLKVRLDQAE